MAAEALMAGQDQDATNTATMPAAMSNPLPHFGVRFVLADAILPPNTLPPILHRLLFSQHSVQKFVYEQISSYV